MKHKRESIFAVFSKILMNQRGEIGAQGESTGEAPTNETIIASPGGEQDGSPGGEVDNGSLNDSDSGNPDGFSPEAQKVISDLRAENAKHRTTNKGLAERMGKFENGFKSMFGEEDQESTPEEQLEQVGHELGESTYKSQVLELAYSNQVPQEQFEYFEFLLGKEIGNLGEDEEMSEEVLNTVIQKAKGSSASASGNNSSVDGKGDGNNTPDGGTGLTVEAFSQMGVVEKSELYRKQPAVYNQLIKEAKGKGLLF